MDEIVVAQNKYISSKRASRLTGYAQDYIGQLVRLGKVNATKVGKAWFVDEAGLMRHISGSSRLAGPVRELAEVETRGKEAYSSGVTAGITYPPTWKAITYLHDDSPLSPISDSRDIHVLGNAERKNSQDYVSDGGVSVKISRFSTAPRNLVSAGTVDGVRFSASERVDHPKLHEKASLRAQNAPSSELLATITTRRTAFELALSERQRNFGTLGAVTWTAVACIVLFLVPFVV